MDRVMTISEYGTKLSSEKSELAFLHLLNTYFELIETDSFLSKALLLMQEYNQRESAELARKVSDPRTELYSIQDDIQESIEKKYPVYALRQLVKIQKDFQFIKQYENESDIPDIEISIPDDDVYLNSGADRKVRLRKIPARVELFGIRSLFEEFHVAFMDLLSDIEKKGGIFSKYFSYDESKGILYFKEKEIEINERKNLTNAHFLLKYLFENSPFEKHFYDELNEDNALDHKSLKVYYDACKDIQKKVAAATGIADFLDFSSGKGLYVRINPDYSL